MGFLVVFSIAVFALAALLGLWRFKSATWALVDLVYYPVGAVGVVLLFANTERERRLAELDRDVSRTYTELQAVVDAQPQVRARTSEDLIDASFRLPGTIAELASVCDAYPRVDPRCMVAERLAPHVSKFLELANAEYASPEARLAVACPAADRLLEDLERSGAISATIARELVSAYASAAAADYRPWNYEVFARDVEDFRSNATAHVEWLRETVLNDGSDNSRFVVAMRRTEVDFSTTLLNGILPCVIAPRSDLERLIEWTTVYEARQAELDAIRAERDEMSELEGGNDTLLTVS